MHYVLCMLCNAIEIYLQKMMKQISRMKFKKKIAAKQLRSGLP